MFNDDYPNLRLSNVDIPGRLDEVGAFDGFGFGPAGRDELFVFQVPFHADRKGVCDFVPSPATMPGHEVLVYGMEVIAGIPFENIIYQGDSIQIVPEPATWTLALSAFGLLCLTRRQRFRGASRWLEGYFLD